MAQSALPPGQQFAHMLCGFWISKALYVAAKLNLGDLLRSTPKRADDLAALTGAHPHSLYRLLRMLASVGIFTEDQSHQFQLTELGQFLRTDIPESQHAMAIMAGEEHFQAWTELLYSIQTGQPAYDKVFGMPVFDWLSQHPDQAMVFDKAMVSIHGRETAAMLDAYDFRNIKTLVDVGGGNGSVLIATLQRFLHLQGILFDLPGVVGRATENVRDAGLENRCRLETGSFFESIPQGADACLMRHIIHDWNDEQCRTILRNVHAVLPPDGRVLVVESVIPPGNDPSFGKLLDLNMLVIPGGQERTEEEYRKLFAESGFHLERIVATAAEVSIVEGRKI